MKKQENSEEIEKIKKQLPGAGAYAMISAMINGVYKPGTIAAMLNQHRTMNPGVLEAAKCFIEINNKNKTQQKANSGYRRQVASIKIINQAKAKQNENSK